MCRNTSVIQHMLFLCPKLLGGKSAPRNKGTKIENANWEED